MPKIYFSVNRVIYIEQSIRNINTVLFRTLRSNIDLFTVHCYVYYIIIQQIDIECIRRNVNLLYILEIEMTNKFLKGFLSKYE